jgi:uncharacterized Zn finger protein (UPF0148 family)
MEIRGNRECTDCGTRWSYYETGSVACPECGSIRSVGLEAERTLHTDSPVEFDLTPVRSLVDDAPFTDVADAAASHSREYVRKRGFVSGGSLELLDDTYLAATELAAVASELDRTLDRSDDEEWYFLELLRIADRGDRPAPSEVPHSMRAVRGLASADAVETYHRELSDWIDATEDAPGSEFAPAVLESLRSHTTRIQALQGDVDPETAETLLDAARQIGAYLRADDPEGLSTARDRLDELVDTFE